MNATWELILSSLVSRTIHSSHAIPPSPIYPRKISSVDDLELLMVGTPHLDFKELEKSTTYTGYRCHENFPLLRHTPFDENRE